MRDQRCDACKHWCPVSDFDCTPEENVFASAGECRRRAPTVQRTFSRQTVKRKDVTYYIWHAATFPPTKPGDWCSEWESVSPSLTEPSGVPVSAAKPKAAPVSIAGAARGTHEEAKT